MREQPTFARWRRTHAAIAKKKPTDFQAKFDSRKPYHWTVLTYLEYDAARIGAVQPTWFMSRGSRPTAWGRILSRWEKGPRESFLVEAWNRRSSDTYMVVFNKTGTFITAFSTTRTDVPAPVYPLSPKCARTLLKLNAVVPEATPREITDDTILQIITQNPNRVSRSRDRVWRIYMPLAESLSLIHRQGSAWCLTKGVAETSRLILLLCPPASQST
jgi:hypothetical protein